MATSAATATTTAASAAYNTAATTVTAASAFQPTVSFVELPIHVYITNCLF